MKTILQTFDNFIYDRSSYCSPATLDKYREDVGYFFVFLREKLGADSELVSFADIPEDRSIFQDFIIELRNRNIRNTTIRSYARSVKTFLRWAYDKDYCPDYLKGVRMPKDDAAPKEPLYQDEAEKLDSCFDLATIKGARNWCIVHLMLDCGLRAQEVRHLQVEHLQSERNILLIRDSKGKKSRFTLAPDSIFAGIRKYMDLAGHTSGYVFRSLKDSEPITQNCIKQLFQDLKTKTGIRRLHAHLLRHTFATSYLIGGGNLEFLRVFLGHYDYSVTQNYTRIAAECKMLGVEVYRLDPIFFTRGY